MPVLAYLYDIAVADGVHFFVKHIFVKCPIFVQCLHWYFLAGQLNPCACGESPHLVH